MNILPGDLISAIRAALSGSLFNGVQSGVSVGAGTATITAVNPAKSFILSQSKGSAGTVAATGTLSAFNQDLNTANVVGGGTSINNVSAVTPSISGGTTNLTVKQYSAVLTNSTTVTFDGPCEWQVISFQ